MDNKSNALFVLWTEYQAPIELLAQAMGCALEDVEEAVRETSRERNYDLLLKGPEGLPEFDTPDEWVEHVRSKSEAGTEVSEIADDGAANGVQVIDAINAAATKPWGQMSSDEKLSLVRATIPGDQ